LYSYSRVHEN